VTRVTRQLTLQMEGEQKEGNRSGRHFTWTT